MVPQIFWRNQIDHIWPSFHSNSENVVLGSSDIDVKVFKMKQNEYSFSY